MPHRAKGEPLAIALTNTAEPHRRVIGPGAVFRRRLFGGIEGQHPVLIDFLRRI